MRKIAVVTGTRADYGLLFWLLTAINQDPELELQLLVTGMHLSPEFGLTVNVIEKDPFPIASKIEMLLSADTEVGITKSMGIGLISFADVYARLRPDIIVVLGDRFEIFSAVAAALIAKIPVAHCHGGELSEGSIDESIRHAITKMSHLHFTATEEYKKRVIQLGEHPRNVFNVGALGIENINRLELLSKEELENSLNFSFGKWSVLVTFHPVTLEHKTAKDQFQMVLDVLTINKELRIIFTKPNADTDGRILGTMIDEFVANNNQRACVFISLGQLKYLSVLKYVDFVLGNSSSGLLEAPSFGIPVINVGDRQRGRIQAQNVIQCEPNKKQLSLAIKKATDKEFKEFCKTVQNPYGTGNSSTTIVNVLKSISLDNILKKSFFDLKD